VDVARVYDAPTCPFAGEVWRHLAPKYDARSGEGARIRGGRFNPPESYPVLYLCLTRPCAVAELRKMGERQVIGLDGLLPRRAVRFDVQLGAVLDLCANEVRAHLDVTLGDLSSEDLTVCREIGVAAHARGLQGLLAPSATGVDVVLALFPANLADGRLDHLDEEWWNAASDLGGDSA
jgi:RES domain-containing protein